MRPFMLAGLAASLTLACAHPTPVPITGPKADLIGLVGEWVGEFSSIETGRSGSIVFKLNARGDSAFGDVLMNPADWGFPRHDVTPTAPRPAEPQPQWIGISFVRVEGAKVSGVLQPYIDPTCGCTLYTVFEGALAADSLRGTYRTRHESGLLQEGRWSVVRRTP